MIRHHYEEKMIKITQEIHKMGIMVNSSFEKSLKLLKSGNLNEINEIVNSDSKINQLEIDIEDECIILIATEQPVAGDLRTIISALKTVTQLERMGDHCVHIAKASANIPEAEGIEHTVNHLIKMGDTASDNFARLMNAYVENDNLEAQKIAAEDCQIDQMHNETLKQVNTLMQNNPDKSEDFVSLLFISRFIERFGDHILNICEWIIYNKTGRHVEF